MFGLFKKDKVQCDNCKNMFDSSRVIDYANIRFCSDDCMLEHFANISTDELIRLEKLDKELNGRCI